MKHLILHTIAAFTLALAGLATTATAQSAQAVKVNVPFEFVLAEQNFPAGEYSLVRSEPNILILRDGQGHSLAQVLIDGVGSAAPETDVKLKFYPSEGQLLLSEVWSGQDSWVAHVLRTKN